MKNKFLSQPVTTCISITERAIKIVQVRTGRSGQKISLAKAEALNDKTDKEILRGWVALFKEKKPKPKSLGRIILAIPRQACASGYVRLPSAMPDEIKEMARLQAGKLLPYDPSAIVFSYKIIQISAEGYTDIILFIVHQDIVKRELHLLEKWGLRPQEITIDAEGICGWLALQKDAGSREPVLIVDLDSGCGRLDILFGGKLLYSRAFGLAVPPDEYKMRLADEINKSLVAYEKENIGQKPAQGFITGADEFSSFIDEDFIKNLDFQCSYYPQTRGMPLKTGREVRVSAFKENSFASLMGMALSLGRPSFNLLPEDIAIKRQKDAFRHQLSITAGLLFLLAVTFVSAMVMSIFIKQNLKQHLSRKLQNVSSAALRIEQMDKKLLLLKNHLGRPNTCLDIMSEVFRIASADIGLILFEYDANNPLILRGQAKAISAVFNFVNALEASSKFKNIQVRHTSKRKVKNEELADFEIVCPIERE